MWKSTSLTGADLNEGTTNVKQVSKNKKPKRGKGVAVAPNLYLKISKKGKKRWVLSTYHKKRNIPVSLAMR